MDDALKFPFTTVAEFEFLNGGDGAEDGVIHRDVDEGVFVEDAFDLACEGFGPSLVGAAGGGEHEASVFEVFFEMNAFFRGEVEVLFSGHDDEGELEEFFSGEFDGFKSAFGFDAGFLLDEAEEFVAEAA